MVCDVVCGWLEWLCVMVVCLLVGWFLCRCEVWFVFWFVDEVGWWVCLVVCGVRAVVLLWVVGEWCVFLVRELCWWDGLVLSLCGVV